MGVPGIQRGWGGGQFCPLGGKARVPGASGDPLHIPLGPPLCRALWGKAGSLLATWTRAPVVLSPLTSWDLRAL